MRRQFKLVDQDEDYLNSLGLDWEAVRSGGQWVLVHQYPVPAGYSLDRTSAAVRIEPAYPDVQLDMVYFHPHLQREDGKAIRALAVQKIDGRPWQRWSRHRTPQNPWRPGEDYVGTHLLLVRHWLERELIA